MSLAQGNNTPTRPRIEPGSPDPKSDALTTRPVRSPVSDLICLISKPVFNDNCLDSLKTNVRILFHTPGIKENLNEKLLFGKSNRKAINRNWNNQKPNPALKTKTGKK